MGRCPQMTQGTPSRTAAIRLEHKVFHFTAGSGSNGQAHGNVAMTALELHASYSLSLKSCCSGFSPPVVHLTLPVVHVTNPSSAAAVADARLVSV